MGAAPPPPHVPPLSRDHLHPLPPPKSPPNPPHKGASGARPPEEPSSPSSSSPSSSSGSAALGTARSSSSSSSSSCCAAMGNAKSGALSKEVLEDLKTSTRYSEEELCRWYESFQRQCPDGRISRAEFEKIYGTFFPKSDPQGYARHVFRSFDTNDDGTLDFREYIIALHLTSSGKTHLKLEWAFSLFDVDRNGEVSKGEVLEIITAIFKMIPPEEQKLLPEDENTPQKRADKLWAYFNKGENDKIAEAEFIEGVMKNDAIMRLIQYEPKK